MRLEKGGKNAAIRGDKVKRLKHSFEPRPITDIRFARIKKTQNQDTEGNG